MKLSHTLGVGVLRAPSVNIAKVEALVAHYRSLLTFEEGHLINRKLADANQLLREAVGIVRRALDRSSR